MRAIYPTLIMGFLAACSPSIPDSGAGVGFDNSTDAQLAREAALNTGQPVALPTVISGETPLGAAQPTVLPPASTSASSSDDIAAETAAALASMTPGSSAPSVSSASSAGSGQAPLATVASSLPPVDTASISDENDFAAVSSRQTIESDAARIAQNKAQYEVVTPTALPTRSGTSQPNIVDFALSSDNPQGNRIYSRSGFNSAAKAARNCAKFASPDLAQSTFLSKGGPQKDRQGLDPDGDGYACTWDPAPFRQAVSN
ncbi:MAG: hypothetical protein COC12_13990 [Rhodobacteraceae bacterium]|nr:MAG: hypothetical protein COC12_13990 [Paracoccaceae bacterium]